jgi:hypothetical protein
MNSRCPIKCWFPKRERSSGDRKEMIVVLLSALPYRQSILEDLSTELAGLYQDTLFIIGNGFDLMHGVKSSYYDFRDTISPQHVIMSIKQIYGEISRITWRTLIER